MSSSKTIYIIHAEDADQHLGSLKKILDDLKSENRIDGFISIKSASVEVGSFQEMRPGDMVILLLTLSLEPDKPSIEKILINLKEKNPDCKFAEIIVDNVPYAPEFIAFPADLQPIRSREDMDSVWKSIKNTLKDFFPVREEPAESRSELKKILSYLIIGVVLAVSIYLVVREFDQKPRIERVEQDIRAVEEEPEAEAAEVEEAVEAEREDRNE